MAFPHDGKKFEEGESGNPNGRPKGKSFKKILEELLDLEATEEEKSDEQIKKMFPEGKVTKREILMARLLITASNNSESKSMERLLNRVDGLPKQSIDHTTDGKSLNRQIIIEEIQTPPLSISENDVDTEKK
jgi:hypothetical protein